MGKMIYQFLLVLYRLGIRIAAIFQPKARLFVNGRRNIWSELSAINPEKHPLLWVHCASLGEFEQGRPLIEKYRDNNPSHFILVTFFSPSGYEIRKNYPGADHIAYLPVDGKGNAEKFVSLVKPSTAIFIKYEFWFFYLDALQRHSIPVLSVSAIFRKEQSFFQFWGGFQRKTLKLISHFFVQDEASRQLLASIDITNVTVTGDTRFDRVAEISEQPVEFPAIAGFVNNQECFIIGSAWPADMEVLIPFINEHDLKFIIAPHELESRFMDQIESDLEKKCVRYSALPKHQGEDFDVLIIDNVGMLAHIYKYGKYAWVGGAFGEGLHNILEAAVFGIPVFFGNKNYRKFREARDLINLGGAFAIGNYVELKDQFHQVGYENAYQMARDINTEYIHSQMGATEKILEYLRKSRGK